VTRILRPLAGGALLALAATLAGAHAHLQSAVPADGSHLASLPANLVLTFSEPARLTVLYIEQEDGQKQGEKQKVSTLPPDTARQLSVPLPRLLPGTYHITFRTLSADGHVAPGELRFTLDPAPK
jgi:methionine-rich copper-binding protein CopC